MKLIFEYRAYNRPFRQPLQTAHGLWNERKGFLLRLTDAEGRCGYGEVAPAPWMGSETLEEAEQFLLAMGDPKRRGHLPDIARMPACRFALDAARDQLRLDGPRDVPARRISLAALLPAGKAALAAMDEKLRTGFRTFKWKIGVGRAPEEMEMYRALRAAAPDEARFRLDGNGGLSQGEAAQWLALLDETGGEFLEQPLPPAAFQEMCELQTKCATLIALDESVADARMFEEAHRRGWKGLYVIKPALFGAMREGDALLPPLRPRIIISSVFETSIGYEAALRWASRWQSESFAAGLGTGEAIAGDGLFRHPTGPQIIRGLVQPESVWQQLEQAGS